MFISRLKPNRLIALLISTLAVFAVSGFVLVGAAKTAQKEMYSSEKTNTLIIEYCDVVNNLLGKKTIFFKMNPAERRRFASFLPT